MSEYQGVGFSDSASIPDDLFLLNPSHQKMVTGKRNYAYLWHKFGCGGVFLTGFFIIMVLLILPSFLTEVRLATLKTKQAKGEVIDHRISKSSKSTSYYVTYQFTYNEHAYSKEESVISSEYYNYELGGNVPVTFVVDDPGTSHIGENGIRWASVTPFLFVGGFFVIFAGIWLVGLMPSYMRLRRMKREGQILRGTLKNSRGEMIRWGSGKSRRTDYDVTVYCQFMNPTGKKVDAHATFTRNDLKKKELQTTGSMAVLYVSDDDYMVL